MAEEKSGLRIYYSDNQRVYGHTTASGRLLVNECGEIPLPLPGEEGLVEIWGLRLARSEGSPVNRLVSTIHGMKLAD